MLVEVYSKGPPGNGGVAVPALQRRRRAQVLAGQCIDDYDSDVVPEPLGLQRQLYLQPAQGCASVQCNEN